MTVPQDAPPGVATPPGPVPRLHRSPRQKVVAGVCGGLGRYCNVDPVIFRIVLGVLSVTGGIGLIFYGFAWLLIPLEGEEENEARRLLSGRVEGASLIAVLCALIGCGLFLSMLGNSGTLAFSAMLSVAVIGFTVWTQHRRTADPQEGVHPAAERAVSDAPPEVKAPPTPSGPSWWRDPIVKDGTTGPPGPGYLWGPSDTVLGGRSAARPRGATAEDPFRGPGRSRRSEEPTSIAGAVFLLAVLAGYLGARLRWDSQPFGTSLQIGLAAALAVFAVGLLVSSFVGRTGFGTLLLAVLTALLLAGASALPDEITAHWVRKEWRPASVAAVQPRYEVGSGVADLDLTRVVLPKGGTLATGVEVGAGRVVVRVPKDVTVKLRARAGLGDINVPGEARHGDIDIRPSQDERRTLRPAAGTKPAGTLSLDLEVGIGQVEVTRAAS
ncbi:PspC domain-containing protein [Streptomyces sp. NBC_01463]|uniref:PspC domain-containing protein n=1 Tax=unclassified Streptomyces TaxID=2593676 RepID=UPI003249FAAD|nr:PspC domain-containing protein [Streptomyces sp. NBC_01104]